MEYGAGLGEMWPPYIDSPTFCPICSKVALLLDIVRDRCLDMEGELTSMTMEIVMTSVRRS